MTKNLLPLVLYMLAAGVRGQSDPADCNADDGAGTADCSPAPAVCYERHTDGSSAVRPLASPLKNHYQCYNTSISCNEAGSLECAATVSIPRQQPTVEVSGPFHLRQYSLHKVFSPHSDQSLMYPNNHLCKYHVRCDEPNSYMSVTLQDLDVEAASGQCGSDNACLDFVKLQYPTGSQCTACGSDVVCRETGRQLEPVQLLNGLPGLLVDFSSNSNTGRCGFHLLAMCVRRTFFEANSCTVPEPKIPVPTPLPFPPGFGKRDADNINSAEVIDFRSRRYYFQHTSFAVLQRERVVYEEREVRLWLGDTLRQRIRGVRVLQVYNDIEGSLVFYDTANGRSFPGDGVLSIGWEIAHYIQESTPSQLQPTREELRLIELLHRGIVDTLTQQDGEVDQCTSPLTQDQRGEIEQAAVEYGRACNGFLRAAACVYQQLTMPRVTFDCLADVPFPPRAP